MIARRLKHNARRLTMLLVVTGVLVLPIVGLGVIHYLSRPPFAGNFVLLWWGPGWREDIGSDYTVYVDSHDHVLLITHLIRANSQTAGFHAEWIPGERTGSQLIIRHAVTGSSERRVFVKWRQNCTILVDHHGEATYSAITPEEFPDSAAKWLRWKNSFIERQRSAATQTSPGIKSQDN